MKKHYPYRIWPWLVLGLAAFGCNRDAEMPAAEAPVIAFVAASTKEAIQEIAADFTKEKHIDVKIDADDSSRLALQITQGGPAHLFLSANEKWAEFVSDKGYSGRTTLLLGNSLVIVTPKGNPAMVREPKDLSKPAVTRVALAGPTVPAGIYARQALKNLKVWDSLEASKKIVSGENVRVVLAYVERGEAEAGIAYATDAKISDKVAVAYTFPLAAHDPIRYPLVLLKRGETSTSAQSFFEYLQSSKAKNVFVKCGFTWLETK